MVAWAWRGSGGAMLSRVRAPAAGGVVETDGVGRYLAVAFASQPQN